MTEVLDESNLPFEEKLDLHDHDKLIELASDLETHRIYTTPITMYSPTPKVLVVVDVAQEGSKDPIDEKTSNLLKKALGEMSMDYAVGNIATIIGWTYEGSSSGIPEEGVLPTHTESEEVQRFYDDHLLKFIEKYEIKTVVCLGQAAYQNLSILPESYYNNLSATKLVNTFPYFGDDGLIITINYHPQFILKNGGLESDSFSAFQNKFKRTLQKSSVDMDVTSKYDIKLVGLDQLDEVLALFAEERDVGTDYEANDLDPWNITTRPTGFSISTDKVARYIIVDRPFTEEEKEKITGFFKKKAPWTYNCKYEMKMTWAKMGKFVMMNDVLVLCTVDGHRGSLKNNARYYLNADLWEEDTSFIVDTYNVIFGKLTSIKKVAPELFKEVIKTGDYRHLISELQKSDCKAHRYRQIEDQFNQLLNVITPEEISKGLSWYPKAWGAVPARILGEYCCMDSIYTVQLKKLLWDKHKSYYQYYIIQSWLACVMESYGMIWDDNYAGGLETFYCEDAIEDLYKLIMLFDIDDKFKEFATKIMHAEIAPDTIVVNDLDVKPYNVKIQDVYCKLDALKSVFNPLSNTAASQAKFWDSYKTDSSLPILLLYEISTSLSQTTQVPEEDQIKLVDRTSLDQTLNNIVEYLQNNPRHSEALYEILSKLETSQTSLFKGFASEVIEFHYGAHSMYSPALSCKACKTIYEDRELEGKMCPKCDSDKVKVTRGVDADNKETWTPEFWMMYYLRRFKKVNKSRSTYIQGQVGRGNVYLGRYTDFRQPPVRLGSYWEIKEAMPDYQLKPNERWIMNTDFNSNAAETLRWTARIHCLVGSTKIHMADGRDLAIEDLYTEYNSGVENYIYTVKDGRFEIENVTQVQLSGYVAKLATVTLDNGATITCTPNHRFMRYDGEYIEAQDLSPGTSMFPFYHQLQEYSGSSGHRIVYQPYDDEWEMAHYLSDRYNEEYDLLRDMSKDEMGRNNSWCRHHIDFNPLNNNPTNVNRYGWVTHAKIHLADPEAHYASWRTIRAKIKDDPEYAAEWYAKKEANGRACFDNFWHGVDSAKFREDHAIRNQARVQVLCQTEDSKTAWRVQQQLGKVRNLLLIMDEHNLPHGTSEEYSASRSTLGSRNIIKWSAYPTSAYVEDKTSHSDWTTMLDKINELVPNHKVVSVSIVDLDEPVPVYDLSVKEGSPCFALTAGIVSHNTVPWNCILGSEKIPVLNESEGEVQMVSVESLAMLPDAEKFFTFSAYTDNLELTPSTGYYARHVKDVPTLTFRFEGDRSITVSEDQRLLTSTGDWIYARDVTHETDLHIANLDFLKA